MGLREEGHPKAIAGFRVEYDGLSSIIDLLIAAPNGTWDVVITGSATGTKRSYFEEAAFSSYLLAKIGCSVRHAYVWYVDKTYLRRGELDGAAFFKRSNVTRRIAKQFPDIEARIEEMKAILDKGCDENIPPCEDAEQCPVCSRDDPAYRAEVFQLYGGRKIARELVGLGVYHIRDIPDSVELDFRQTIQRELARSGGIHLDRGALVRLIDSLVWPRVYLDFEAYSRPIPLFDGLRPWQFVPSQYSLQIQDAPGQPFRRFDYIVPPGEDGRSELASSLFRDLGTPGSLIVYSAQFERRVIEDLVRLNPEHGAAANIALSRIVDLLELFKAFGYYNPLQRGKVSLKNVLPALSGTDYSGLAVQDGLEASILYQRLAFDGQFGEEEKVEALRDLELYCRQDTQAMITVVEELEKLLD